MRTIPFWQKSSMTWPARNPGITWATWNSWNSPRIPQISTRINMFNGKFGPRRRWKNCKRCSQILPSSCRKATFLGGSCGVFYGHTFSWENDGSNLKTKGFWRSKCCLKARRQVTNYWAWPSQPRSEELYGWDDEFHGPIWPNVNENAKPLLLILSLVSVG